MKVRKRDAESYPVLCWVSTKPPGLELYKDEGDEGVSGINVGRFVERREGKGCSC
jgi:hypothetical protein